MTTVKIVNNYKDYLPRLDYLAIVARLISEVPISHMRSLTSIVLTNSTGLNAKKSRIRSEGRKIPAKDIAGLYHRATKDGGAWIELYVALVKNHGGMESFIQLSCFAFADAECNRHAFVRLRSCG